MTAQFTLEFMASSERHQTSGLRDSRLRKFFSKSRNPGKFESSENEDYKVSFLGASFAEARWDEHVRRYPITFAMVVTGSNGRIVDSKELLPTSAFASKDVKVSETSIFLTETGSSTEYSILTVLADLYKINIIRASNLYLGEATPHCVHLPSQLWQLIADSEEKIKDFGRGLPVRTSILSKSAERVGKNLTLEEFNPIFLVPEIDTRRFRFGIHFEPPPNRPGGPARIFYAEH